MSIKGDILSELGRVGNNLNRITRALNDGEQARFPELKEGLLDYLAIRAAIFTALGKKHRFDPCQPRNTTKGEETMTTTVDKWTDRTVCTELEFTQDEEDRLTALAAKTGLTLEEYVRVMCGFQP
jgi:hypothetical protein